MGKGFTQFVRVAVGFAGPPSQPGAGGARFVGMAAHLGNGGGEFGKMGAPFGKVSAPFGKVSAPFGKVGAPF